MKFQDINFYF